MIYVASTFVRDKTPFSDVIKLFKENHIYNIEIGSNHSYEDSYKYVKSHKECNFLVHNYFPVPRKDFVINIASENKDIREASIKCIKNSIAFSEEISAGLYTFHPGFHSDPSGASLYGNNYDFKWLDHQLSKENQEKHLKTMLSSLDRIVEYANKKGVKIAIETEGSYRHPSHLLMQTPEEFKDLTKYYKCRELGINVNIGHLHLASKFFGFPKSELMDSVSSHIVAFELSHNNGLDDQHLPLKNGGWYWDLIFDSRYKNAYKILEFRNQSILEVKKALKLIERKSLEYLGNEVG